MTLRSILLLTTLVTLAAGCASIPKPLAGDFAGIRPDDAANSNAVIDSQVRWGGSILSTYTDDGHSCMEILGQPLNAEAARPTSPDVTTGRFVACKQGFLDPAIFTAGREVTVTGSIRSVETRQINDFDYRYAVVSTDVLFLWPEEDEGYYYSGSEYEDSNGYYVAKYRRPYYSSYGYGGFGYGGFGYGGFYNYPYYFGGFGHGFFHGGHGHGFGHGGFGHRGYGHAHGNTDFSRSLAASNMHRPSNRNRRVVAATAATNRSGGGNASAVASGNMIKRN